MAELVKKQQKHFDVLAEGLTADGRVAKRVEARADDLADVAEAFRLAAAEARTAHIAVARVRLTAGQAGVTKLAVTLEDSPVDPLTQSAMLDGKTKLDAPPPVERRIPRDQIRLPSPQPVPDCPDCGVPVGTYHQVGCPAGPGPTGMACPDCRHPPGMAHGGLCKIADGFRLRPSWATAAVHRPSREQELLEELARQAPGWMPWTIEDAFQHRGFRVTGRVRGPLGQVTILISEQMIQKGQPGPLAAYIIHAVAEFMRANGHAAPIKFPATGGVTKP